MSGVRKFGQVAELLTQRRVARSRKALQASEALPAHCKTHNPLSVESWR